MLRVWYVWSFATLHYHNNNNNNNNEEETQLFFSLLSLSSYKFSGKKKKKKKKKKKNGCKLTYTRSTFIRSSTYPHPHPARDQPHKGEERVWMNDT